MILPPKRHFNIWRGKSEALLRAGDFHKSMTSFPNPRQGKRSEKKISRLRRGFSYTPPAPVRTGAVSRILQSSTKFHKYENTEYRHYISLHRTAGFDDRSQSSGEQRGKVHLIPPIFFLANALMPDSWRPSMYDGVRQKIPCFCGV